MPMVMPAPLTADDYRELPETGPRYQLVEGDLYLAPAPSRFHQDISFNIEFILAKHLEASPAGRIYHAPFAVYLNKTNVFQPDIVFIAREHYGGLTEAGLEGAPDLVVEILSPKTARLDLKAKKQVYARSGVAELWIVDPAARTVAVYRLLEDAGNPKSVLEPSDTHTTPLLPGLVLRIADFFKQ